MVDLAEICEIQRIKVSKKKAFTLQLLFKMHVMMVNVLAQLFLAPSLSLITCLRHATQVDHGVIPWADVGDDVLGAWVVKYDWERSLPIAYGLIQQHIKTVVE